AAEETAAAAPAQVGLGGVAFGHRDLFGRTHVGDGQHHVGGLALQVDPAGQRAQRAVAAAEQAADDAAERVAAGVRVLRDEVRHQHVVGGTHLATADVGTAAQVAAGGEVALGLHRGHAAAAVDQGEA